MKTERMLRIREDGPTIGLLPERSDIALAFVPVRQQTRSAALAAKEGARRLVACWNACIGIGTEEIEERAWQSDRDDAVILRADIERAQTDRDELIKALRDHDGWLERTGHGADHPWRLSIGRVLAKHTPKVPG